MEGGHINLWRDRSPSMNRDFLVRLVGVSVFRGFRVIWGLVSERRDLVVAVPGGGGTRRGGVERG